MSTLLEFVLELLFHLLDALRWWRCCLALIASMGLMVLLQCLIPNGRLETWLSIATVVLGLMVGLIWEWRGEDRRPFWG